MNRAPHRVVDDFESRLQPLETQFNRAYWESQVRASAETDRRRAELELQLRALQGDRDTLMAVNDALDEGMHEPLLRRRLEVLKLSLTENQMTDAQRAELVDLSTTVESEFATFRPEVDGRAVNENEILEVLRHSSDETLRRRTWFASKEIGKRVAGRVRELARLRNHIALELGYADYYEMALELQELSEDWLFGTLAELEQLTTGSFRTWKAAVDDELVERFGTTDLRPWHYSDPFFQHPPHGTAVDLDPWFQDGSAVGLTIATFDGWGIDLRPVIDASDLFPRPMKCQHAFCLDVDRSGDVRILANVVQGERWVDVMLHEAGHAAYDVATDHKLPYVLRTPAHTFVTEAIALLCGRLTHDAQWLMQVRGVAKTEVEPLADRLKRSSATQSLLFARWVLVMAHFERALYADPEGDLDKLWWDLVQRFQSVAPPDDEAPGAWTAKIHVAAAPVYYHNYLLGELLASQLETVMRQRFGGVVGHADAGEFLKQDLFRHGASVRWDVLVEEATGGPLSARDFAAQVTGLSG